MSLLAEKDAVHETIANYCHYFDGAEFEKWIELFTDDGVLDVVGTRVIKGSDAFRAFVKDVHLVNGSPMMKHCTFNEVIDVDADEATVKSYVLLIRMEDGLLSPSLAGRYEDHLVKRDGRWLFKNRKVHLDLRVPS
jgi:hypothetical protein